MDYKVEAAGETAEQVAFREIFDRNYHLTYSVALRVLRDVHEAEEVAQETFMSLHYYWPKPARAASINAWLARVALNLSFNKLRKQKRNGRLSEKLGAVAERGYALSAEETTVVNEERRLVRATLLKLKRKDGAALVARHCGLDYREVAQVVGVKTTSVGKLLERAETRFKKAYEELSGGDLR